MELLWFPLSKPLFAPQDTYARMWLRQDRLELTGLSPTADVRHKHNQDKEQSAGQASAVLGDPLYSLPDRPQPGLRVPEPLFRCDRWLHPGHRSGPVSGRSASFFPLLPRYVFCVKSQCIEFPRCSQALFLMALSSEQQFSKEYASFLTRTVSKYLYFEKYDWPCFLRELRRILATKKMAVLSPLASDFN